MNLLGKQVLPLPIKKSMISASDVDRRNFNAGAWLRDEERTEYYKKLVDVYKSEYDDENFSMKWYIFAICADNTFVLRSETGLERAGLTIDDFEVVKDGDTW